MATGYVYNGFGKYETKGKEAGLMLQYGGINFWLPYGKVTAIPDFHFREVDHAATAEEWEAGNDAALIYRVFRVPGVRVVEEFVDGRTVGGANPVTNRSRGIVPVTATRTNMTDKVVKVPAGSDDLGNALFEEVRIVTASPDEIAQAETLAEEYKRLCIEEYFDSKRDRLSGGQGHQRPTGLTKVYMKELGVEDIDQVATQRKAAEPAAASPELMQEFLSMLTMALSKGMSVEKAKTLATEATKKIAETGKPDVVSK